MSLLAAPLELIVQLKMLLAALGLKIEVNGFVSNLPIRRSIAGDTQPSVTTVHTQGLLQRDTELVVSLPIRRAV